MSDDEKAIRQLFEDWMRASRAGDNAAVLDMLADDVLFLLPGREPFGKAEFAQMISHGPRPFRLDSDYEIGELMLHGDWAHCWCRLRVDIVPTEGAQPIRRRGHTLTLLRKRADGRWVYARDANLLVVVND